MVRVPVEARHICVGAPFCAHERGVVCCGGRWVRQASLPLRRSRAGVRVTPRNVGLARHTTLKHRASHDLDRVRHVMVRNVMVHVPVEVRAPLRLGVVEHVRGGVDNTVRVPPLLVLLRVEPGHQAER